MNIFALEVAVEDVNTDGEKKGLKTAHETLLDHAGWTRPYCYGGAVQQGNFRPVSGFLNGLREGYKAVTVTWLWRPTGCLRTCRRHHLRSLQHFQEVHQARRRIERRRRFRRKRSASPSASPPTEKMDLRRGRSPCIPKLHARSLEYLSSFKGGMEDPSANQQMLLKALVIKEEHCGEHHLEVAITLTNLSNADYEAR